jgi:transcription elongation GreA/GreB family factor
VVGCEVKLKTLQGEDQRYFVVGAYDGDPDNHCISYKTPFGKCLMNRKPGDKFSLPDGTECEIQGVESLSSEMKLQFADEA